MTDKLIEDVCLYIDMHINDSFSIDDIANEFHFNKFYLMRMFKASMGVTINQYVNNRRIYNSVFDVIYSDNSMLKVALDNGFNSLEYFSEQFTRIIGLCPTKFRSFYFEHGFPFTQEGDNMKNLECIQSDLAELKEIRNMIIKLQSIDDRCVSKENGGPQKVFTNFNKAA